MTRNIQLANLSQEQINAISKYEEDFTKKFDNKNIVLIAMNKQ